MTCYTGKEEEEEEEEEEDGEVCVCLLHGCPEIRSENWTILSPSPISLSLYLRFCQ